LVTIIGYNLAASFEAIEGHTVILLRANRISSLAIDGLTYTYATEIRLLPAPCGKPRGRSTAEPDMDRPKRAEIRLVALQKCYTLGL
jgi:hypothetical protein